MCDLDNASSAARLPYIHAHTQAPFYDSPYTNKCFITNYNSVWWIAYSHSVSRLRLILKLRINLRTGARTTTTLQVAPLTEQGSDVKQNKPFFSLKDNVFGINVLTH